MSDLHHPVTGELLPRAPEGRTALRLTWRLLPPELRAELGHRLGSPVIEAESQESGFTPGFASRLLLADGRRYFVKAAHRVAQRAFSSAYAEEARVLGLLPAEDLPAPRLMWADPDVGGWTVVAFEDVAGVPPKRPWRADELAACLAVLEAVAAATGEVDPGLGLKPMTVDLPTLVSGWDLLAEAGQHWPHHGDLAELAHGFVGVVAEHAHFVHLDGRDDNFLVLPDGSARLCDWNWPALGPVWVDVVHLLVSVHGDGRDAGAELGGHPLTRGVAGDEIDTFLAAFAGFMAESDLRPVPRASPHLGAHRRWWAAAAYSWLAQRRGW